MAYYSGTISFQVVTLPEEVHRSYNRDALDAISFQRLEAPDIGKEVVS